MGLSQCNGTVITASGTGYDIRIDSGPSELRGSTVHVKSSDQSSITHSGGGKRRKPSVASKTSMDRRPIVAEVDTDDKVLVMINMSGANACVDRWGVLPRQKAARVNPNRRFRAADGMRR